MTTDEAIAVCEQWFAHLERQREHTLILQRAAALARSGDQVGALRLKSQVDSAPRVFDGGYLEPAVRHLVDLLREDEHRYCGVDGCPKCCTRRPVPLPSGEQ